MTIASAAPGSPNQFDVAIVGAGLAGGSLALRLARSGVSVALLDANSFPREKICGEFLSPECWDAFDDLGLTRSVLALDYHPIHRVRLTTPRGREVVAAVVDPAGRPGIGLSRWTLDDLLLQEARRAGVRVFEATRATGAIIESGQVVGVTARSTTQGVMAIHARVTVAADGRQSTLVKQTGTIRGRSWFRPRLFGMKQHLETPDGTSSEQPGTVGLHLIPGGYGGTCRIEGGLTNLCALLPESAVRARRGDLDRVAAEELARNPVLASLLGAGTANNAWKTVAGVRVQTARPSLPGIVYVGDGQGTVDPLGGQGMTMALLGATELAPVLGRNLGRTRAGMDAAAQAQWDTTWRSRFGRRIWLCRAFHHWLVRPTLTDCAATFGPAAGAFLAACYAQTRDRRSERVRSRPVA